MALIPRQSSYNGAEVHYFVEINFADIRRVFPGHMVEIPNGLWFSLVRFIN